MTGYIGRTASESTPWWDEPPTAPAGAPNIIYIVFDDTGFADFGCFGSEIHTPTIDRLAAGGLRYTNYHTPALCSPSRAALLTGRNHHSVGMAQLSNWDNGFPGSRGRIAKSAGTIGEMLRPHGYNTFAVGKWHLTPMSETGPAGPFDQWPTQRGFDRYYGFMDGATNQWEPVLTADNHPVGFPDDPDYHLTVDLVDQTISLITNQQVAGRGKPFFCYLALGANHSPHHVPQRYIDKYVPVFAKGWDVTRAERHTRQLEMGVIPAGTDLPPRNPDVRPWDELSADEQAFAVQLQAAYAGMLEHTDEHLGRLVAQLERLGILDNTLIVLMSDNGASQEGSPVGTLHQGRYFERAPITLEQNIDHIAEIGQTQWFNNYPLGWAMASNTPLKWYKQNTHGGGVRDPLVMHWPRGLAAEGAEPGGIRHQFCYVNDITPTVLDLLGVEPPATVNGVTQQPIEGVSLRATLAAADVPTPKRTQYFEMLGHRGIVHDGWKAVTRHPMGASFDDDVWELYHLDEDFSEAHDLAAAEPERLRAMIERWWVEAGRYQVLPIDERGGGTHRRNKPVPMHWRFLPGVERLPTDAAPAIAGRSYTITADIELPEVGPDGRCAEGVIIAHGDRWDGYTLYLRDGRPVHDYHFPMEHTVVAAPDPLGPGRHTVRYEFLRTGRVDGVCRLLVDGVEVASAVIPRIIRGFMPFEGLDIGADLGSPVGDYESPFRFTGTIHEVVVELLTPPGRGQAAAAAEVAAGTQ